MIQRRPKRYSLEDGHPDSDWLRGCAGKGRYTSEATALAAVGLQVGRTAIDVYHCTHCDGWHQTDRRKQAHRRPDPVHILAFVCGLCGSRSADIAVSSAPWTPETRRAALLNLERLVARLGWSIGADLDHCPICARTLGLETGAIPP